MALTITEEETDRKSKKSTPKWSFAGVVNAAFHSNDEKKRQAKVHDSSGIELDYIHPKTEADRISVTSVNSYYMDRDFRYYFQHPYFRLAVAYLVTFCNFLIYAEDPVAHSDKECFIPVVGNCFSFVCTKYPNNGWAALKVILWLIAILVGLIVGKLLIHAIVFSKCTLCFLGTDLAYEAIVYYYSNIFQVSMYSNCPCKIFLC